MPHRGILGFLYPQLLILQVRHPSPQRGHTCAGGYNRDRIELQAAAAARVLWVGCVQAPASEKNHYPSRVVDLDQQGGCFYTIGTKGNTCGSQRSTWVPPGALCCSHKWTYNTTWPGKRMITNGSAPSRMKVWVTSPGKSTRPAKVIAEDEGICEWMVKEGEDEYQLWLWDQL